jgi:hypothetical protein
VLIDAQNQHANGLLHSVLDTVNPATVDQIQQLHRIDRLRHGRAVLLASSCAVNRGMTQSICTDRGMRASLLDLGSCDTTGVGDASSIAVTTV